LWNFTAFFSLRSRAYSTPSTANVNDVVASVPSRSSIR